MKKITGLFGVTVAAAAAATLLLGAATPTTAFGASMIDGPEVTWRVSLWGKRRAFTEGLEHISEEAAKRTGGKFKFKLYYGQQLSKSKENLDAISVGAVDAALFCAAYHPQKNAPLNVLDLPFLPLGNFDVMRDVHNAIYATAIAKNALLKWKAVLYQSSILPQYEYMGRGKPPANVADFKGMRLRALGGMGRSAKAMGAVPTTVPASEVYNAIARGTVDAVGFPFTYAFSAYKVDEVAEWYTTNMSLGTVNCPIVFNQDSYAKLPEQYKALLEELKAPSSAIQQQAYAKKDKENLMVWPKKMKAITIEPAAMDEFRKLGGVPLWTDWVNENKDDFDADSLLKLVLKTAAESCKKHNAC
jgi:TRAP-type C4-dicarboxylate transport system substrate-binding protein